MILMSALITHGGSLMLIVVYTGIAAKVVLMSVKQLL
jgi:hypothetical protein